MVTSNIALQGCKCAEYKQEYERSEIQDMKNKRVVVLGVVLVLLLVGLTIILFPYVQRLQDPQTQAVVEAWVQRAGIWGCLAVLGVQILQVVIAFIPGEPIELIAGALYGTWGGLALCLCGTMLASAVIFLVSKKLGKSILDTLFGAEKVKDWKWLYDSQRMELVTFLLFLIPGTPKDMLTYVVGVTDMTVGKFLLLSSFARIPSVITSTMMGDSLRDGNWQTTIVVFLVTALLGVVGITCKGRVINFCRGGKRSDKAGEKP